MEEWEGSKLGGSGRKRDAAGGLSRNRVSVYRDKNIPGFTVFRQKEKKKS